MAAKSGGSRYVPVLVGLLLLTFGGTAWLLYALTDALTDRQASPNRLVYTQAASLQAHQALRGDAQAWDGLAKTSKALGAINTTEFTDVENSQLVQAQSNIAAVLAIRTDVETIRRIIGRLGELVAGITKGVRLLQNARTVKKQPVALAQLQRLRLLGLNIGSSSVRLTEGNERFNSLLRDTNTELQQLTLALQNGDEKQGLAPLNGNDVEAVIAGLGRRATLIDSSLKEGLELSGRLRPAHKAADALATQVRNVEPTLAKIEAMTDISGLDMDLTRVYGLLGASMVLIIVLLVVWVRSSGSRRQTEKLVEQSAEDQQAILQLLDELESLADGDLTVQATVNESITGAIADSVNYAIEALRDLVQTINDSAILLEDATRQTESSAKILESGSEDQARQVKDASHAVRQIAASIDEVSGDAERSADVARHSVDIAHKGGDAVRRTIAGMSTIRETIQETSKRIKRLGESSQEIGDIVELINDIADQTNVLALNASIQASMAGEAGRGFAVVADEVQRLAERSANATKQIEVLVSTIQSDTNEAVVSMERSTTDVVGGALLAENAGAALEEIEQVSNQIAMLVQNISGSAKDQAQVAKAVLKNVEQLQEISVETDKSAGTTSKYVSKLSALTSQLRKSAAGFRLPGQAAADSADSKEQSTSSAEASPEQPTELGGSNNEAASKDRLITDGSTA
jgi:twitching motility protein PilJ